MAFRTEDDAKAGIKRSVAAYGHVDENCYLIRLARMVWSEDRWQHYRQTAGFLVTNGPNKCICTSYQERGFAFRVGRVRRRQ